MTPLSPARRLLLSLLVASLAHPLHAQAPAQAQAIAGPIRIWGHGHRGQDYILTLLRAWQTAFQKSHPGVTFDDQLTGNASGLGGLYTGVADLALLDREASFIEVDAFQQGTGYDPFKIPVVMGSVSIPHHAPALKLFVNRANPLSHLSLAQLDAIFDADHRNAPRALTTWGDLGLTGPWAAQPIHLYTYEIQSAEVQFFKRAAMKGSQKFNCCLTIIPATGGPAAREQALHAALANDKFGLALGTLPAPALKPVALSATDGGDPVLPSDASYPLARTAFLYANRKPKSPVPAHVADFLAFIVSPEGQAIAASTGGYRPLSPALLHQAQEALQ